MILTSKIFYLEKVGHDYGLQLSQLDGQVSESVTEAVSRIFALDLTVNETLTCEVFDLQNVDHVHRLEFEHDAILWQI